MKLYFIKLPCPSAAGPSKQSRVWAGTLEEIRRNALRWYEDREALEAAEYEAGRPPECLLRVPTGLGMTEFNADRDFIAKLLTAAGEDKPEERIDTLLDLEHIGTFRYLKGALVYREANANVADQAVKPVAESPPVGGGEAGGAAGGPAPAEGDPKAARVGVGYGGNAEEEFVDPHAGPAKEERTREGYGD